MAIPTNMQYFNELLGEQLGGGGGGGGSSDLNNPIELELIAGSGTYDGALITKLTAGEIYELCQTGTPYFTVTAEQVQTYSQPYKPDTKYFINEYNTFIDDEQSICGFFFVMLSIADTSDVTVKTILDYTSAPVTADEHLIIAGGL